MSARHSILTLTAAALLTASLLAAGCTRRQPRTFTVDVMNVMTPVKDQGASQLCWAYAMLAAIETEHIMRGDSVNLSVAYVDWLCDSLPDFPESRRAVGQTLLNLIQRHGLLAYDAYRQKVPGLHPPRRAFMLGMDYTLTEFAHSVCAPGEYLPLMSDGSLPYQQWQLLDVPDNWEHNRFWNVPADTLIRRVEQAVRHGHGICWEGDISEPGFDWAQGVARCTPVMGTTTDDHAMAIVGLAHDADGNPYFIMKNSWGTDNALQGLLYMSFDYFLRKTVAVYMTRDAFQRRSASVVSGTH